MSVVSSVRALPRVVWVVCVATFVNRCGTMALPFLALFLAGERRMDPRSTGVVLAVYGVGALVAGPAAGWLVSRVGARVVMLGSLSLSAAALIAIPWLAHPLALDVVVLTWAFFAEAFRPAAATLIADQVPAGSLRQAYAVIRLATNLGMSIGPLAGGLIAASSFNALFVIDGATSLAAAVWIGVAGSLSTSRRMAPPTPPAGADVTWQRCIGGALAWHLVGVMLVGVVAYQGLSTMALYMTSELGLAPSAYGFLFAASGLVVTVCELPVTLLASRWTHSRLLTLGAALTGAGFAMIAFAHSLGAMFATMVVWTFGEIVLSPAAAARAAELDPPSRRGLALGLYSGAWSAALAAGPVIGTMSLRAFGGRVHWLAVGAVGLVAALVFALTPSVEGGRVDGASDAAP